MKKKILIIVAITIFLIIAIICMVKIKKAKDIEAYKRVGEYVFELYAENRRRIYGSEHTFLKFCQDEKIATIVKRDIHIERIDVLNQDTVLILREPWLLGIQGYIIVKDDEELVYELIPYEDPDCEKLGDGIYSFKWISMP